MRKYILSIAALLFTMTFYAQDEVNLTLEQSLQLLQDRNKSLKIANKQIEFSINEHQKIKSFWLPTINATGAYIHTSNKIEVKQSLNDLTNPIKDYLNDIFPNNPAIGSFLDQLGGQSLVVPMFPQNITTVDANITYPIFTGGKRIYASKIGKKMVEASGIAKDQVDAGLRILLIENYYGLRLAKRIVDVRQQSYNSLETHYQNALKLEENGMINKAERLFVEVNLKEAKRELQEAEKNLSLAQKSLKTLLKFDSDDNIIPISSLFVNDTIPSESYYKNFIKGSSYTVKQIEIQKSIADNSVKIANSAYLPEIALMGKQTLYSHGIQKNLMPRTFIGAGFTWNIFDGFSRERSVKEAKIKKQILDLEQDKMIDDNKLAVDQFYTQMQKALDNITALKTTIEMSQELLRIRQIAFKEGMATSTEVIDAEVMLSKVEISSLLAYYEYNVGLINLLSVCGIPETFTNYSEHSKTEEYVFNH